MSLHRRIVRLQRRAKDAERLAELGTLTRGVDQEIKNPLSTIQLNLQLLGEDLPENEPFTARIVNRLTTVQREASRVRDILETGLIEVMLDDLRQRLMPEATAVVFPVH